MKNEKSLYEALCSAQEFFRNVSREIKTGYPYVSWSYNIERREEIARKKEHRQSILRKASRYAIGATATIAALSTIVRITQYSNPPKEPQLRPSAKPNAMVWSYPGNYQQRNFMDKRPYGSLDEVVLRTKDGKVISLRRGDNGFAEQEQDFLNAIVPYIERTLR